MRTTISNVEIKGVATWLPTNKLSLMSFCGKFPEKGVLDVIKSSGAETVYRIDEGQKASDICFNAAEVLFEKSGIDKSTIDGLVFVSSTRDWVIPDTSVSLQHRLGLSTDTVCQDINYGCAGYVYGILQASAWINCGLCSNVLVLASEVLSPYLDPDAVGSIETGEAGTASIISKGDSHFSFEISSNGQKADKIQLSHGGYLFQDGMTVFTYGIVNGKRSILAVMEQEGWEESDVELFALHQSNQMIIKNIRMAIKSTPEKFPTNMKDFGNTGCASIPLLLCDMYGTNTVKQPSKAILCAYGVGLTCASVSVDLSKTHFYGPINR
ncbi:MAG: ketoacyl-ACP synthase III [Bacteroidales bacterium]|nr:ketoacyl-ACP synthase III [Bacteroidales bacterium]